jgi:aminopeptidase N
MSPYFITSQAVSSSGVPVTSYYFSSQLSGGPAIAQTGAQAVSVYSSVFGPYPYDSLAIVETIIPDGMEQDGLVFLNTQYYARYDGSLANELTTLGVHEIAHQWWYGKVGNDQTMEPWLDEALSVYSEHIFYENTAPELVNWWWQYRVNFFQPSGWVDTTVYQGGSFRTYVNAVYLDGALFLQDLRDRIGDQAFFSFLADYSAQEDRRIATADDFFRILRQHTDVHIRDLISAYFQNPH